MLWCCVLALRYPVVERLTEHQTTNERENHRDDDHHGSIKVQEVTR